LFSYLAAQLKGGFVMAPNNIILDKMVEYYEKEFICPRDQVIYTKNMAANQLVLNDAAAFLFAACLDRTGYAYSIWETPYKLKQSWGHLDVKIIKSMDPSILSADPIVKSISGQVSRLQLAKTIISTAKFIDEDCHGDPNAAWSGETTKILERLQRIFGVGPGIARMIVILRILHFGLKPRNDGVLLPKIDTHITRLLQRTGLSSSTDDQSLRSVFQGYDDRRIAMIDNVMWGLGQSKCLPTNPKCLDCPINDVCAKLITE
jgi:endonuclease III